jgi:hypothetical protein
LEFKQTHSALAHIGGTSSVCKPSRIVAADTLIKMPQMSGSSLLSLVMTLGWKISTSAGMLTDPVGIMSVLGQIPCWSYILIVPVGPAAL